MDGLGVDEGDGEALRCQLDGKVNCWDDMALKRTWGFLCVSAIFL
jgi:hypothetical protein